jgi:hypothetical protein
MTVPPRSPNYLQPVPKMGDSFEENGPIDEIKTPADVKQVGPNSLHEAAVLNVWNK